MPGPVASPETALYLGILTDAADGFGSATLQLWGVGETCISQHLQTRAGSGLGQGMAVAGLKIVCGVAGIS